MTNFSGGRTTTSLLSFLPLSVPGSLDSVSGGMLVFPGMYIVGCQSCILVDPCANGPFGSSGSSGTSNIAGLRDLS